MTEDRLQTELEKLRREVNQVDSADPALRQKLSSLISDIEKKLDVPGDEEHHHHLLRGIREAINQFETQHPRATAILNDIMVALSNLGI